MYSTALQTKKSYLDNETTLIQSVRSALSKSDLDLIIDNR